MQKKIILITGATSGIGRHAALHLARQGHRVLATGRREEALASLRAEAGGTPLETLRLDVADPTSIATAAAEVDRRTDGYGIDVLVNNAGYGTAGPMEEVTPEDLRAQFETNVFGLVAVTQAFLPAMRERGAGRIINVSSVGGRFTLPLFGAYNATKHALESMSDAMRMELAPFGVQVSLIEPGVIATGFSDRSMLEVSKYQRAESPYAFILERAAQIKEQTDKQAVGPQSVARAIQRAATSRRPRARYVAPFRYAVLLALVRVLPTRWTDWLITHSVGLTRKRLRQGTETPRLQSA